jgi:hypothetical protein
MYPLVPAIWVLTLKVSNEVCVTTSSAFSQRRKTSASWSSRSLVEARFVPVVVVVVTAIPVVVELPVVTVVEAPVSTPTSMPGLSDDDALKVKSSLVLVLLLKLAAIVWFVPAEVPMPKLLVLLSPGGAYNMDTSMKSTATLPGVHPPGHLERQLVKVRFARLLQTCCGVSPGET